MKMNLKEKREYLIRRYEVDFDARTGILTINKPIKVKDFITLKKLLKSWKVKEYRVSVLGYISMAG